jgi:hypothetical protein
MPQKNLVEGGVLRVERDGQGRIEYMSFIFDESPDARLEEIDTSSPFDDDNGKTAISAYLTLMSYGIYDAEGTDMDGGLAFMFASPQLQEKNGVYASELGYVAKEYNGVVDFGRWPRYRQDDGWYVPRWAVVNRSVRGQYKLTRTRMAVTENVETKGDWLWAASQNINLKVRTLPFHQWAEAVLETASVEDPAERAAVYWDKYNKARARNTERQRIYKDTLSAQQGRIELPTALSVKVGEELVPLEETAHQDVLIHYPAGDETHPWNGSVNAKIRFARVASQGYECELLG